MMGLPNDMAVMTDRLLGSLETRKLRRRLGDGDRQAPDLQGPETVSLFAGRLPLVRSIHSGIRRSCNSQSSLDAHLCS